MTTAKLSHSPLRRRHHRLRRFFCTSHCQTRTGRLWRSRGPSSTRQRRRVRAGLVDGAAVLQAAGIAWQVADRSCLPATACHGQRALRSVQAQPLQQAAASRHGRAGGPGLRSRLLRLLLRSGAAAGCIDAAAPGLDGFPTKVPPEDLDAALPERPPAPRDRRGAIVATDGSLVEAINGGVGSAAELPGFGLTLEVDLAALPPEPEARGSALGRMAELRAIVCGAQVRAILSRLAATQPPDAGGALVAVAQSTRDHFFVAPSSEQVTVVFPMHFQDGDESTLAASLLQEFVEARRTPALSSAPFCSYAPFPPLELKGAPAAEQALLANAGYVSLVIFPRHVIGPKLEKTTWSLINFHAYISYHIKCSKTFIHARMRRRGDSLIQVGVQKVGNASCHFFNIMQALNKAKPDLEKDKKTAQGRSFKRQIPSVYKLVTTSIANHGHRSSLAQVCPTIQHAHKDGNDPLSSNLALQGLSWVKSNAQQGMREGADANAIYLQRSNFGMEKDRKHRNDTTVLEKLGCGLVLSGRVGQYPCCGQPFLRPLIARSLEEADEVRECRLATLQGLHFILLEAVDQVKGLPPHCGVSVLPEEAEERLQGVYIGESTKWYNFFETNTLMIPAANNDTDGNSALRGYNILPAAFGDEIRHYLLSTGQPMTWPEAIWTGSTMTSCVMGQMKLGNGCELPWLSGTPGLIFAKLKSRLSSEPASGDILL
eukprot:SM000012S25321  [mRNA]  locus=s12:348595:358666:+ [translate_table: standard]